MATTISRNLIQDVQAAVDAGGKASTSSRADSLVKILLITALLDELIDPERFDTAMMDYGTSVQAASRGIADNNNEYDKIAKLVQKQIGVAVDGRTGLGTFGALLDYVANKRWSGSMGEVGSPQTVPTAADIIKAPVQFVTRRYTAVEPTPVEFTRLQDRISGQLGSLDASMSRPTQTQYRVSGQSLGSEAAQREQEDFKALEKVQDNVEAQLAALTATVTAGYVYQAQQGASNQITGAIDAAIMGAKNWLVGAAQEGEEKKLGGVIGKLVTWLKSKRETGKLASDVVIPVAVILAVGMGGRFLWRRYIKRRKNRAIARALVHDPVAMREIAQMIQKSGMDKYAGTTDGYNAINAIEAQEARQPYMRGY